MRGQILSWLSLPSHCTHVGACQTHGGHFFPILFAPSWPIPLQWLPPPQDRVMSPVPPHPDIFQPPPHCSPAKPRDVSTFYLPWSPSPLPLNHGSRLALASLQPVYICLTPRGPERTPNAQNLENHRIALLGRSLREPQAWCLHFI